MQNVLENICYIIITGCGIALARYIVSLVNKKVDEIQINTEIKNNEKLNQYVNLAQDAISNAVLSVSQVYVDSLKASGSFTEEAQAEAKERAVERAKKLITEESKNAIIILYGDFDSYLDSMIEAVVRASKIQTTKKETKEN